MMFRIAFYGLTGLLSILAISFTLYTNTPADELSAKLEDWHRVNLTDRLFLHVDKDILLPGETLWFKAYCMNPNPDILKDSSRFLEAALVDAQGRRQAEGLYRLQNHTSSGWLKIPESIRPGRYNLVAYSDVMKRKGSNVMYSRPVRIYRHLPGLFVEGVFSADVYHPGQQVRIRLYARNRDHKPLRDVPFKYKLAKGSQTLARGKGNTDRKGFQDLYFDLPGTLELHQPVRLNVQIDHMGHELEESIVVPTSSLKLHLDFFPVGGQRVRYLSNRMAFKATDHLGRPVDVKGYLFDQNNRIVRRFESFFNGMGTMDFQNDSGRTLNARITHPFFTSESYPVPEALDNGFVLDVSQNTERSLQAVIRTSSVFQDKPVVLLVHRNGSVYHRQPFHPGQADLIDLPLSSLPMGVLTLTLLDHRGIPRAERLVFANRHKSLHVDVHTDRKAYRTKDSVALEIRVKDHTNQPVSAEVSLSVSNLRRFVNPGQEAGILSGQLLSHEVKGHIWDADAYFDGGARADTLLDHLLLTQGWRRFSWEDIAAHRIGESSRPKNEAFLSGIITHRKGGSARYGRVEIFSPKVPLKESLLVEHLKDRKSKLQLTNPEFFRYLRKKADKRGVFRFAVDEFDRVADTGTIYIRAFKRNGSRRVEIELFDRYEQQLVNGSSELADGHPYFSGVSIFEAAPPVAGENPGIDRVKDAYSRFDQETVHLEEVVVTAPKPLEVPYELKKRGYSQMEVTEEELRHTFMRAQNGFLELLYHVTSDFYILGNKVIFRGFKSMNPGKESGALIVLDGIPYGENYHTMDDLSLENIRSIKVVKNPGASLIYKTGHTGGLIVIETKTYAESQVSLFKDNFLLIEGYRVEREFYSPRYGSKEEKINTLDTRNTLYWNPSIQLDSLGRARVSFYNSDKAMEALCIANVCNGLLMGQGKYHYRVYGIDPGYSD